MGTPLSILLVEDSEDDATLLLRELRKSGYEPTWERVDTARDLKKALARGPWQVVACDCAMPRFNAVAALKLIHAEAAGVPAIVVSGETADEVRESALRAGALAYVSKAELNLVPSVIGRVLQGSVK